jgi:hypothetical protein
MPFFDQSFEEQEPEQYHLLRKLAILLLLVVSTSLWMYVLLDEERIDLPTTVQEISAGVCIALVAGLGAQLILSKRDGFFRFVAAMTGEVAGVYLLGFVSDGKYGISEFGWLPKSVDYDGLNLIGLGFILILFICLIFRRTRTVVIPESVQVSPLGREPEISSVQIEPLSPAQGSRVLFPRVSWSGFFMPGSQQPERSNGRSSRRIQPTRVKPMAAPKRSRRRGKARVQLALVEEHRCPYCLELVNRSDPHGVTECKVCHALHHKDCWDITGSCQVPHLNT